MPVTAAAISAGIGGAQSAFGIYQYVKGRQEAKKAKRPTYEIPSEIKAKLGSAQQMALEGMPEEQKKQYIENLQRAANFQLQAMGERKGGLVGAAELGQTQADAYKDLLAQDVAARRANQMYLGQVQSEMAAQKDKQWELNKMAPYQAQVTAAQAMQGAGLQNIWGGAGSMAKNIMAAGMYSNLDKASTLGDKTVPPGLKQKLKFTPGTSTDEEIAQQAAIYGKAESPINMTDYQMQQAIGQPFLNPSSAIAQSLENKSMLDAVNLYMKKKSLNPAQTEYFNQYRHNIYDKINSGQALTPEEQKFWAYYQKH